MAHLPLPLDLVKANICNPHLYLYTTVTLILVTICKYILYPGWAIPLAIRVNLVVVQHDIWLLVIGFLG